MLSSLILFFATACIVAIVLTQCRRPWGAVGRLIIWQMNRGHSDVTDWGLGHAKVRDEDMILDIGCGGGRTVGKLAAMASAGKVFGLDYSKASVAAAHRQNGGLIDGGRVLIACGTVSKLPFDDEVFDLATAVETHYYWPDLVADLTEVRRVLKPGARLIIIAETYRGQGFTLVYRLAMKLLGGANLTVDEHRSALASAGLSDIEIDTDRKKGWICAVATTDERNQGKSKK
jgi:SAM-dependent methyltransferase